MANWYVSSVDYSSVAQWQASHAYSLGAIVRQLATPTAGNEACFVCTTAGTSGASEPTWGINWVNYTTNTTDNTVVWHEITGVATYNGDGGGTNWAAPHARINTAYKSSGFSDGVDHIVFPSTHAETWAAATNLNFGGNYGNPYFCVPHGTIPPTSVTTGATVTQTVTGELQLGAYYAATGAYFYGVSFIVTSGTSVGSIQVVYAPSDHCDLTYESCVFNLNNTANTSILEFGNPPAANNTYLKNCTLTFGAAAQTMQFDGPNSNVVFQGCTLSGTSPTNLATGACGVVKFRDMDLSGVTGALYVFSGTNQCGYYSFENCKIYSGVTVYSGTPNGIGAPRVRLVNCSSSGINYAYYYRTFGGTVQQDTTHYRTGGASNGTTSFAMAVTTDANAYLGAPMIVNQDDPMEIWSAFTSGSHTATIYLASNSTLNNQNVFAELEYLGSSASPLGTIVSSRAAFLATPTTLTTDGSTWGGSPTNVYKISLTYTPAQAGTLRIFLYATIPSVTFYYDPAPVLA
jgi:hypothetical protein